MEKREKLKAELSPTLFQVDCDSNQGSIPKNKVHFKFWGRTRSFQIFLVFLVLTKEKRHTYLLYQSPGD